MPGREGPQSELKRSYLSNFHLVCCSHSLTLVLLAFLSSSSNVPMSLLDVTLPTSSPLVSRNLINDTDRKDGNHFLGAIRCPVRATPVVDNTPVIYYSDRLN